MMSTPGPWLPLSAFQALADSEVHIWRARLDVAAAPLAQLHQVLSPDEQQKAARFHFERDQRHYTAARGILRSILGRYLEMAPTDIQFSYNSHGKPDLDLGQNQASLRFNLAHSHGLALFAFTRGREIGVDLELIRPEVATQEIAQRFFARTEVESLLSLPEEIRPRAFFNCWTRKEAFMKARGLGFSLPLNQFAVTLTPGREPALISAEDDPRAPSRWRLRELDAAENYVAAVAVEGDDWELRCFDYQTVK